MESLVCVRLGTIKLNMELFFQFLFYNIVSSTKSAQPFSRNTTKNYLFQRCKTYVLNDDIIIPIFSILCPTFWIISTIFVSTLNCAPLHFQASCLTASTVKRWETEKKSKNQISFCSTEKIGSEKSKIKNLSRKCRKKNEYILGLENGNYLSEGLLSFVSNIFVSK